MKKEQIDNIVSKIRIGLPYMFWIFIVLAVFCAFKSVGSLLTHDIIFDEFIKNRPTYEFYLLLTVVFFCFAIFCNVLNFALILSSNRPITFRKKMGACCLLYLSVVTIFALIITFADVLISYTVKADEFNHYGTIIVDKKELTPCESTSFLKGRTYSWYVEDTMYQAKDQTLNPNFIDAIKKHANGVDLGRKQLQELIKIDNENVLNNLIEMFYFSLSVISTLGFGDITPINGAAKLFCSIYICLGQFITLLVFAKIFAQKETDETSISHHHESIC